MEFIARINKSDLKKIKDLCSTDEYALKILKKINIYRKVSIVIAVSPLLLLGLYAFTKSLILIGLIPLSLLFAFLQLSSPFFDIETTEDNYLNELLHQNHNCVSIPATTFSDQTIYLIFKNQLFEIDEPTQAMLEAAKTCSQLQFTVTFYYSELRYFYEYAPIVDSIEIENNQQLEEECSI